MRIPFSAVVLALCATAAIALDLAEPPLIRPDANGLTSVTLTVDAARVTVVGAVTFTTRAYHVDGKLTWPGPTLVLRPGGTLSIRLVNRLGPDLADTTHIHNSYHSLNTTNIHTHGLHVDPFVDSVFVRVLPGGETTYLLKIPANHAPGLHWYHGHVHGSTTLQVVSGLAGMMVVEPPAGTVGLPDSLAQLTSHLVMVHSVRFAPQANPTTGAVVQDCDGGAENFNPFKTWTVDEISTAAGYSMKMNPQFSGASAQSIFFVNGQVLPSVNMAPGERRLIKLLWASAGPHAELSVQNNACAVHAVAFDGVYIAGSPRLLTTIGVVTATRLEIVVTCASAGTFTLAANAGGRVDLLQFVVSGTAVSTPSLPATLDTVTRPQYLMTLMQATPTKKHSLHFSQGNRPPMCQLHLGQGSDCSKFDLAPNEGGAAPSSTDPLCPFKTFQGERGTTEADVSKYEFVATVGDIAEFVVHGLGREPHPLHIHVNHFQVTGFAQSTQDGADAYYQIGDWRDTLPALAGRTTIRFPLDTFSGEVVVHCHVLPHEDRGLMSTFLVKPNPSLPTTQPTTTVIAGPPPVATQALTPALTPAITPAPATTQLPTQAQAPTTSVAPLRCTVAEIPVVSGGFRIHGNAFAALVGDDAREAALANALRVDISRLLVVDADALCIAKLAVGSLIVRFVAVRGTDARAASALLQAGATNATWLQSTRVVYEGSGGNDSFTVDSITVSSAAARVLGSLCCVLVVFAVAFSCL